MQTANVITRRPAPRPLDESTNGHAPGSEQVSSSNYPSSEEEDDDDEEENEERRNRDQSRLRNSTPIQLLDDHKYATEKYLFCYLLLFRSAVALITSRTVFAPDEHWQSLEIAHDIAFGYGYKTWEWTDRRSGQSISGWADGPIRSVLYPALFVPMYWILKKLALDETILLSVVPSLVQALLAALTDIYTFKLARKLLNERAAWITLIPTICSLYTFHTSTRTLSNSTEAAFSIIAFYYWPLSLPENSDHNLVGDLSLIEASSLQISVAFFALSTCLRPSNVLLSLPLVAILMQRILRNIQSAATALESTFAILIVGRTCLVIGFIAVVSLTFIDSLYFGQITFTPAAFLKRNVLQSISIFYGQSPIHFYLTSALPFICLSTLPYTIYGFWNSLRSCELIGVDVHTRRWHGVRGENDPIGLKAVAQVSLFFILTMSFLGHKEVRFLQPITPFLHIFEGYALSLLPSLQTAWKHSRMPRRGMTDEEVVIQQTARLDRASHTLLLEALSSHTSSRNRRHLLPSKPRILSTYLLLRLKQSIKEVYQRHQRLAVILLGAHIIPIIYLSFHSYGQVAVAEEVGRLSRQGKLSQIGFLMPCHSTPWMSHLHDKRLQEALNAWFITCEPPLDGQDIKTYKDESDYFYDDPYQFLLHRFSSQAWPSHVSLFTALLEVQGKENKTVGSLLESQGYSIQSEYWNSLFHLDHRRRGNVLLMKRSS